MCIRCACCVGCESWHHMRAPLQGELARSSSTPPHKPQHEPLMVLQKLGCAALKAQLAWVEVTPLGSWKSTVKNFPTISSSPEAYHSALQVDLCAFGCAGGAGRVGVGGGASEEAQEGPRHGRRRPAAGVAGGHQVRGGGKAKNAAKQGRGQAEGAPAVVAAGGAGAGGRRCQVRQGPMGGHQGAHMGKEAHLPARTLWTGPCLKIGIHGMSLTMRRC